MTTGTTTKAKETSNMTLGAKIPFDGLTTPGAYVCEWSGHLLRVPADAIMEGRSPLIGLFGRQRLILTKISNDPFIALTKARTIAADHDVVVNF